MENLGQFVKKSEYARMHGWDRSYINKLQNSGRVVLSPDGKKVDWLATDALIGSTSDPSKIGVKLRWQQERAERTVFSAVHAPSDPEDTCAGAKISPPVSDSTFQTARTSREHYNGQLARLEYELLVGLLVSRKRVEDSAHTIGRNLRDRVLGLAPRIAPELAAISDSWELEQHLTAALRRALDDIVAMGAGIMKDVYTDSASDKLTEIARAGRERYGATRTDNDDPSTP